MSRREFSRKTRAAVFLRAGGCCEACGARLKVGEGQYDHILADQLGGEPTAANCRLICTVCHKTKTADDIRAIRRGDRMRDRASGVMPKSKHRWGYGKDDPLKMTIGRRIVPRHP